MKYIGNFQNHNLPKSDYRKLYTYLNEREIILSYNSTQPFYIEQISIMIDNEYMVYAVFECGLMFKTDTDAKQFGIDYTSALIDLIRNYGQL